MNLFSIFRKMPSAPPPTVSLALLPVLKAEYTPGQIYVIPRLRDAATGQELHLDRALAHYPSAYLTGPAGIGKSSALAYAAGRAGISVLSLADYHPAALPAEPRGDWLLFDDARRPEHRAHLEQLRADVPHARIWAAGDPEFVPSGWSRLDVQPLNDRELTSFAQAWFPLPPAHGHAAVRMNRAAESFLASVKADPGTRALAALPLYLFLMVQVYGRASVASSVPQGVEALKAQAGEVAATPFDVPVRNTISALPTRRAVLFDTYVQAKLQAESDMDFALRALEGIALSTKRGQVAKSEHLARGYGFLVERPSGRVEFAHPLLQDFFAARALRRTPDFAPLREHLHDPAWREVVLLYAGLGARPSADGRPATWGVVEALLDAGDLLFAAHALAESPDPPADLLERIVKPLVARAWDDRDERALDALGGLFSNSATDWFAAKLRDKSPEVRRQAAHALGALHTDRALEYLLPQLRDTNPDVRDQVVAALGKSRSDRVVEPLLVALRGDPRVGTIDTRMRLAAARALGEFGADKGVPALIVDLQVGEPEVRAVAAQALIRIRSPFAVKPLQSLAETHQDETVRAAAAQVLVTISSESLRHQ